MPVKQVSKLAGHESSDITAKVYLAWADDETAIDMIRSVMEELGREISTYRRKQRVGDE